MSADRGGLDPAQVALLAFGVVVLAALLWVGSTSTGASDPYNPGDDGASELRQTLEANGAEYGTADGYDGLDPDDTVAVVVASAETADDDRPTDAGLAAPDDAESFVRDGGTLVVLADDPDANGFLEAVGASARLDGQIVRDDRHHYRGPAMPIATEIDHHELTDGVERLALNRATVVEPNGAVALARTSEFAVLVDRPDAARDEDAVPASRPVATAEAVGSGTVIVVGDAAFATNELQDVGDNDRLLVNGAVGADRVLLLSSEGTPPLSGLHAAVLDRIGG